jgi:hypothetical protein
MATQIVVRLEERQLAELEKKLLPLIVQSNTSDLMAGFTLGQQSVLKMLRDGFTISA